MQTSVLYVTDTRYGQNAWHDPSARHRCYHFADALVAESWKSAVIHIEQLNEKLVRQFGHVIFHRPNTPDDLLRRWRYAADAIWFYMLTMMT